MSSPHPNLPPVFPGMPGMGQEPGGQEEPSAARQLIETGLLVLSLVSVWPLMLGYDHWIWYALAVASGVLLTVLLIRRIARMHKATAPIVPPPPRPLPPGTPKGRRISEAPGNGT